MSSEEENVILSNHARFNRIPLRFGVVPTSNSARFAGNPIKTKERMRVKFVERNGTQEVKSREVGRKFRGTLTIHCGVEEKPLKGTTIVLVKNRIITVYREGEGRLDDSVKREIDGLYKEKQIDSDFLANHLHGPYIKNQLSISILKSLLPDGNEQDFEAGLLAEQENKNRKENAQDNERKRAELEGNLVDVGASPICLLLDVNRDKRINSQGKTVQCTRLIFEGAEWPERIMDEWADPDGSITEKARNLIGKPVFTIVWQPEIFDNLKWWRSIHEAVDIEADG